MLLILILQTFTISATESERAGKNTFLMSISGKSENHSVIDHIYNKEIEHLSTKGQVFLSWRKKQND